MTTLGTVPTPVSRTRYLLIAAGAAIAQMLMMIPGYSEDGEFQIGEWLVVLLISLVVSAVTVHLRRSEGQCRRSPWCSRSLPW